MHENFQYEQMEQVYHLNLKMRSYNGLTSVASLIS